MSRFDTILFLLSIITRVCQVLAFSTPQQNSNKNNNNKISTRQIFSTGTLFVAPLDRDDQNDTHPEKSNVEIIINRRSVLTKSLNVPLFVATGLLLEGNNKQISIANAAVDEISSSTTTSSSKPTSNVEITTKIFIQLKGLPTNESGDNNNTLQEDIITIGLFGKDAPQPVSILEKLVSSAGYPASCKPKEVRTLQREQLEANKVYNSCMETQETKGVSYDLSTVWRIIPNERIDIGAVSGKFVAREFPNFEGSTNTLKHDAAGVVSVRVGNDGGFGFTIYPGGKNNGAGAGGSDLDETHIVVGRVIDGMDVVRRLNQIPVVQSTFSGGDASKRSAPSRACRYGSQEMFCNEFKPLKKISVYRTGIL